LAKKKVIQSPKWTGSSALSMYSRHDRRVRRYIQLVETLAKKLVQGYSLTSHAGLVFPVDLGMWRVIDYRQSKSWDLDNPRDVIKQINNIARLDDWATSRVKISGALLNA